MIRSDLGLECLSGARPIDVTVVDRKVRYEAKLVSRTLVAAATYELSFEVDDEINFKPGQYAWLELENLLHPDTKTKRRAFSIISPPQDKKRLTFAFRARSLMSGYKQSLLELPLGSDLIIEAPFGSSTLPDKKDTPVVFVAGGIGISSFLSMLRDMERQKNWRPITLVYANKDKKEAAYLDELRGYCKSGLLKLHEVYGALTPASFEDIKSTPETHWYLSGPHEMIDFVGDLLTQNRKEQPVISSEEFFPAALNTALNIREQELVFGTSLYKMAIESASNHIVFTNVNGSIVYANKAAQEVTGYSLAEMQGNTPRLWGGLMDPSLYKLLWKTIKYDRKSFVGKIKNRRKSGEVYVTIARISPIMNADDDLIGFLGTEEDITELEKINQAKTEFVSLASHQLRTPLSSISWYTEMLLDGDAGSLNDEQKKYLQEVYVGNKRMVDLVNALLNTSRLELGTFKIEPKSTDVKAVAVSVIEELKPLIQEKKTNLFEVYPKNFPPFMADPKFLRMIFQNLLSNAIKYTPDGGRVNLTVDTVKRGQLVDDKMMIDDSLVIMVADNGYGIPLNQQREIFSKMFRADNVLEKDTTGTGLGLYIVKSIIDNSGGMIWFKSRENKGTTFYVTFPLSGMKEKIGDRPLV